MRPSLRLVEGETYRFGNVFTDEFQGCYSVSLNSTTVLGSSEEAVSAATDGVIIGVLLVLTERYRAGRTSVTVAPVDSEPPRLINRLVSAGTSCYPPYQPAPAIHRWYGRPQHRQARSATHPADRLAAGSQSQTMPTAGTTMTASSGPVGTHRTGANGTEKTTLVTGAVRKSEPESYRVSSANTAPSEPSPACPTAIAETAAPPSSSVSGRDSATSSLPVGTTSRS